MNGKLDVVVDIETTGTCHDAGILTLAAVVVQAPTLTFYEKINWKLLEPNGFIIQRSTMEWWDKKSAPAREEAFSGTRDLPDVLNEFTNFLATVGQYHIWSDAASFDLSIISDAYDKLGIKRPWHYRSEMCYRTIKNMFLHISPRDSQSHSALIDAQEQARHLEEIFGYLRATGALR